MLQRVGAGVGMAGQRGGRVVGMVRLRLMLSRDLNRHDAPPFVRGEEGDDRFTLGGGRFGR